MPTYKNNTDSRIVDQGIAFDPGQEKSVDKILIEEALAVAEAGVFVVGETVTDQTSSATGVILRDEDDVLDLVETSGTFAKGNDVKGVGTAGEILGRKVRLSRTSDEPYYIPVTKLAVTVADAVEDEAPIDIDNTRAVAIKCSALSVKVGLNATANIVRALLDNTEAALIIPTDGNINKVLLTGLETGDNIATVYQFESVAQAESYFA